MDNFIFSINATLPIFLTMVLGLVFRKIGVFDDAFTNRMNSFVFKFALPALSKGKRWYRVFSTEEELKEEMLVENQKETVVNERTIIMFLGR